MTSSNALDLAISQRWSFRSTSAVGQDFTSDKALLRRAIAKYNGGLDAELGPSAEARPLEMMAEDRGSVAFRRRASYESLADTLKSLAEYLGDLPNKRKALVLVSEGIPMNLADVAIRQGLSDGDDAGGTLRNVYITIREMLASAQRGNVNVYPVDPVGLMPDNPRDTTSTSSQKYSQDFLQAVALGTGGFPILDTNDAQNAITQVFRENSSYYLIGCASRNLRTEGRFRRLDVRVNRPGLTVRSRSGYYEPDAPKKASSKPSAASSPLWSALASLMPKGDIAMQVAATPLAVPGTKDAAVAVTVALRQPAPLGTERVVDTIDLVVSAFNESGDRKASQSLNAKIALRPGGSGMAAYELLSRLDLKPGRYQLRVAAQSSLQAKSGSVFADLEVPDFSKGPLAMSSIVFSATTGLTTAPKEALANLLPVVPTSLRDFDEQSTPAASTRIYQPGKEALVDVTIQTTAVDATGHSVFESTEVVRADRFAADRAANWRVELPIWRFKPGRHLITVTAVAGTHRTSSRTTFVAR